MIALQDICFYYEKNKAALSEISLEIESGATVIIAGPNGSGKSTLLHLLAGLSSPDSGKCRVNGLVSPGHEKKMRTQCGFVFQNPDVQILGASVGEDLCLGYSDEQNRHLRVLADRLGLSDLWDRHVDELSGGEKKRLCLATALAGGKKILLMDEPLSGLDYPGIQELRVILNENRALGITQVIASHDLEPLADLTDQVVVLSSGKLIVSATPLEVMPRLLESGVRPPCSWLYRSEILAW